MRIDDAQWSLEYIEELGASGEHSWIDYKKSDALNPKGQGWDKFRIETSKDISAFSIEGGYIVYGVDGRGKRDAAGGVLTHLQGSKLTSEWISQAFSPLVTPPIKIDVKPLPHEKGDRAVYVVCVPESLLAPHQALDNKYYGRLGDRSQPLPDGLVRAIMFRQRYPVVRPRFSFETKKEQGLTLLILHVDFHNYGPIRARDFTFHLDYPSFFVSPEQLRSRQINHENMPLKSMQTTSRILHPEETLPITAFFALTNHAIPRFFIEPHEIFFHELPIRWKLWADDSPPATGEFTLYDLRKRQEIQF